MNIVLENAMPPAFEHPHGYTFSVKEEEGGGLSVGFVKVFILFSIRLLLNPLRKTNSQSFAGRILL